MNPQFLNELTKWGGAATTAFASGWALWMHRKSRQHRKNEEDAVFIDNAAKAAHIWEGLSLGLRDEISNLREEIKSVRNDAKTTDKKYHELKIEFEVMKRTNEVIITQLKAENSLLRDENNRLKDFLMIDYGQGNIRQNRPTSPKVKK